MGAYGPRPYPMPMQPPGMSGYPGMMRPYNGAGAFGPQPYPPSGPYPHAMGSGMGSGMGSMMGGGMGAYPHQFASPFMQRPSSAAQFYQQGPQNPYSHQPYGGPQGGGYPPYPPMHQSSHHRPHRYNQGHGYGGPGYGGGHGGHGGHDGGHSGHGGPQGTHGPRPNHPMMQNQMDASGLPQVQGDVSIQYPQTFRLEEHLISAGRGSYSVKDMHGEKRYKVESHISLHGEKAILNSENQVLLKLRESRALEFRDKITIFNPADIPVLTLQQTSAIQMTAKRVHGYLGDETSGPPTIIIAGNHNNTLFHITNEQNIEIATIRRRKYSMKNMMTDQDSYQITINYGSPAMVCLITVAIDEMFED